MERSLLEEAMPLILRALAEDFGDRGDITSQALLRPEQKIEAELLVKGTGVVCGLEVAEAVFKQVSQETLFESFHHDGAHVAAGTVLSRISGMAHSLLTAERTALNFLGRLSGIATLTHQFVDRIDGTGARILDTRKTMPGWRKLEKYAVTCGGGTNHRLGLFDLFLVKDNHILAAGGISQAVQGCRQYMRRNGFSAPIEVEAKTMAEVEEALQLGVERIMLDNMTIPLMRTCVQRVNRQIPLEASGGVRLETVREIAATGVDFISVGALTHSAPVLDISMEVFR